MEKKLTCLADASEVMFKISKHCGENVRRVVWDRRECALTVYHCKSAVIRRGDPVDKVELKTYGDVEVWLKTIHKEG